MLTFFYDVSKVKLHLQPEYKPEWYICQERLPVFYCDVKLFLTFVNILKKCLKNIADVKGEYEVYARYLEERQTDDSEGELETQFSLTRTGNNVIVLFCDRFASAYFPYLLEQFPELRDSYEGFTYYPNCISFATNTLLGAPAMMGGYEYTPMQMNQREGRLVDLHNESTMVLPVYFDNLGYDVKVVDPPHVNYVWESDYTPFEAYPDIEVCSLINNYKERYEQEYREDYTNVDYGEIGTKNCRLYALTQMLYPPLRNVVGGNGRYYTTDNKKLLNIFKELLIKIITNQFFSSRDNSFYFFD